MAKSRIERMNDAKRRAWIESDPDLYKWWKESGKSILNFIQANRMEIDDRVRAIKQKLL